MIRKLHLLPLVVSSVSPSTRPAKVVTIHQASAASKFAVLEQWLKEGGGWMDPRLVLRTSKGVRALFALKPISDGDILFWLPQNLLLRRSPDLRLEDAYASRLTTLAKESYANQSWIVQGMHDSIPMIIELAATLAREVHRNSSSSFSPYIQLLPQRCPSLVFSLSLIERYWLGSTPAAWTEAYRRFTWQGLKYLIARHGISESIARWSLCMVISRAGASNDGEIQMTPGADFLNHVAGSATAAIRWEPDISNPWESDLSLHRLSPWIRHGEGMGVKAIRKLDAGERITWTYGQRSNVEMQTIYGFSALEHESAVLSSFPFMPIDGAPALSSKVQERLDQYGCESDLEGLGTATGVEVHLLTMDAALKQSLRCTRFWLRRAKGTIKESEPWSRHDMPLLTSLREACERLYHHWARSFAWITPDIDKSELGVAVRREISHVGSCVAATRLALAKVKDDRRLKQNHYSTEASHV